MVSHAVRPGVGAVGARLLYPDGLVQHAGVVVGLGGVAGHVHIGAARDDPGYFGWLMLTREVSAVTAACLAVPRRHFDLVGGLDAKNLPVAFNDVDFCLRLRAAGLRIIWTPHAELVHHESKSRGSDFTPERIDGFRAEIAYMERRWARELYSDPFYNPNLSLATPVPTPAFPPRAPRIWSAPSAEAGVADARMPATAALS
jgi:GT2 family glycosyltransferase